MWKPRRETSAMTCEVDRTQPSRHPSFPLVLTPYAEMVASALPRRCRPWKLAKPAKHDARSCGSTDRTSYGNARACTIRPRCNARPCGNLEAPTRTYPHSHVPLIPVCRPTNAKAWRRRHRQPTPSHIPPRDACLTTVLARHHCLPAIGLVRRRRV